MKIYSFLTILFVCCVTVCADVVPLKGIFTISAGDYKLDISGEQKLCITKIFYKGYPIGMNTGFYGSILAPVKSQFVGAGHTEGGEEKIVSVELSVDGKKQDIVADIDFKGQTVKLTKTSILDKLQVSVELAITDDGIRIDKKFEALDDQSVFSFYIFQFCWTNQTENWMVGRPDGTTQSGVFQSNNSWLLLKERELLWYALFDPKVQKGIMGYFASYYPRQGQYMLWDKKVYHKFYFWPNLPKVIKKGTKSRIYTMILKGLSAKSEEWEKAANASAAALAEKYSQPSMSDNLHFDFENAAGTDAFNGEKCLLVQGNGSFRCEKVPVSLQKNSTYKMSFVIRKTPDVSSRGSDHFVLVGRYDENRKFHILGTCASNTPKDNKWHSVTLQLQTSENTFNGNVYIYNKNSNGSVWLDELDIEKTE